MNTYENSTIAAQLEQDQTLESAVRPTLSPEADAATRPTGHHQITPAQEATLREMFGIQIRRRSVNECLDND